MIIRLFDFIRNLVSAIHNQMALHMNGTQTNQLPKEILHLILYGLIMTQIKQKGLAVTHTPGTAEITNLATC